MQDEMTQDFQQVKDRLDEIIEQIDDDEISLDDALTLYEEAVALGLKVGSLLEENISEQEVIQEIEDLKHEHETMEEGIQDKSDDLTPDVV